MNFNLQSDNIIPNISYKATCETFIWFAMRLKIYTQTPSNRNVTGEYYSRIEGEELKAIVTEGNTK